jgi:hypothetical protein
VKQARWLLLAGLVVMMMTIGCEKQMGFVEPKDDVNIAWHWEPDPEVFTIVAGQNHNAGNVSVWNTTETLYIKYEMTGNWWIEQTHAHVALTFGGIPQKNGGPIPGKFEFSNTFDPRVRTWTYAIPIRDGWNVGSTLYIAAHCVVVELDAYGNVIQRQTGWSGQNKFPKGWALYITYTFKKAYKDVNLPTEPVTMAGSYYGWTTYDESYWKITLSNVPPGLGYDVWNGDWRGWCAQSGITWNGGANSVVLWSTANPSLPGYLQNAGWDNVNYLLNNHPDEATVPDLQTAFWLLLGEQPWSQWPDQPSVLALQMVADANANGEGWYPTSGDWIAVICDNGSLQRCFIEVDP